MIAVISREVAVIQYIVGDRNHFLTLDVNPHSSLVPSKREYMKAEINGNGKCSAERDRGHLFWEVACFMLKKNIPEAGVPLVIFPLWWLCYELPDGLAEWPKSHLVDDCGSGTWQRCAILPRARPLWTTLLFHARYSYLHTIRQNVQSGSGYTLPWKVSKHEIEPSRRLNVHTRMPFPKDQQIFIKYTRFRFSDLERWDIRHSMDKAEEKCGRLKDNSQKV